MLIRKNLQIKKIHKEILFTKKTFKQIGKDFNCSGSTISDINYGKTKNYILKGYTYPLRTKIKNIESYK